MTWRLRVAALAVSIIAASATISLAITAWAYATGHVPPDSNAPTLVQVFFGWEGFFGLLPVAAVPALIGGLAWASLLRTLNAEHSVLYPLGGILIAGMSSALLFGFPLGLPSPGPLAAENAIENGIVLLAGGIGGGVYGALAGNVPAMSRQ